ncbi:MAG TPA: enoyl-CoA hydratase-related protein [Bryobacteraceae bacterium]|nr:enoyl-CoA hydratase-related protein [Bryobacteraceae bacterium]
MPSYQKILYAVEQGIARITLNRPEKRNALDAELITEVRDALRSSARDENVRVVLITGAGSDFCSGADLSGLERTFNAGVLDHMADARNMAELFLEMRHHPRPIVAAVRGRALAGGCGLATACDLIVAAESSKFGYPEVNIGFVPAMVMAILRRSLSEKRAFEMIASGEIITAQTALDFDLINAVFADETFDIEVEAFVSKLASKSASAITLSKRLLYHMDGMTYEAAIEAGVETNAIARMTDDMKRGVEKFLKK